MCKYGKYPFHNTGNHFILPVGRNTARAESQRGTRQIHVLADMPKVHHRHAVRRVSIAPFRPVGYDAVVENDACVLDESLRAKCVRKGAECLPGFEFLLPDPFNGVCHGEIMIKSLLQPPLRAMPRNKFRTDALPLRKGPCGWSRSAFRESI